jgi:5-methylthioadenosine/S-adenosylhomocysteine deaminase
MKAILLADTVLTLDAQDHVYSPGYLVLEDDRIVEIGPRSQLKGIQGMRQVDMAGKMILPGLVNAHTHTPMVLFRGIAEGHSLFTYEGWYNSIRVVEYVADAEMVSPAVEVPCAEMIRSGTTTFADQYFYMDRVLPVVRQSGMRAVLCYGIVDEKDDLVVERELSAASAFLASAQGEARIKPWLGPHAFFEDNRVETIQKEIPLAQRHNAGFHIHLLTDGSEDVYCRKNFGVSAAHKMNAMGLLKYPILAAHCIQLQEEDMPLLAGAPFTAVICPSAAMRSGAGAAPLKAMRLAGVNTALGTDNVANSNSYDLFGEMGLAAKLMSLRERQPAAVTARQVLEMATLGGARALGLDREIGSLEAGKKADLVSLDMGSIGWAPRNGQDFYTALVYAQSGLNVRDAMVDGEWLLREAAWTTLDYLGARSELEEARAELDRRIKAGS